MELKLQVTLVLLTVSTYTTSLPDEQAHCEANCSSDDQCEPGEKCIEWCPDSGGRTRCLSCNCLNGGECYRKGDPIPNHLDTACDCPKNLRGKRCQFCRNTWTTLNGNCYRIFTDKKYNGAKTKCSNNGATLAYPKDLNERADIEQVIADKIADDASYDGGFWLPLYQVGDTDGTEEWDIIEETQKTPNQDVLKWTGNNPNNPDHECTRLIPSSSYGWRDVSCTSRQNIICMIRLDNED